jgi:hypothetical protein
MQVVSALKQHPVQALRMGPCCSAQSQQRIYMNGNYHAIDPLLPMVRIAREPGLCTPHSNQASALSLTVTGVGSALHLW